MAKQSSVNLDITNNADGFDISGGTIVRKLGISGGDVTIAGSGSAVVTFPSTTTTIAGIGITQSFTVLQTFNAGLSASGATFSGNIFAPNIVNSFNGSTGAVQGVSAAVAGTGISVSGATGSVTITNTGVQSFNGLTGAVTGVTAGGANTFTALNSFGAGISAAGGVTFSGAFSGTTGSFSKLLTASGGLSASGATFSGTISAAQFSGVLTSCTGLPVSTGITGFGSGIATFLATPTSANLKTALTDETGTGGKVMFSESPLVTELLQVRDTVGSLGALIEFSGVDNLASPAAYYGVKFGAKGTLNLPFVMDDYIDDTIRYMQIDSNKVIVIGDVVDNWNSTRISVDTTGSSVDITGNLNLNGYNILPLSSVVTTAAALSNVNTTQNAFPVGQQTLTVATNTTYLIEGEYVVNSGTTTHTTAIGFSVSAADVGNIDTTGLEFTAVTRVSAANTITTGGFHIHVSSAANSQTAVNTTGTNAQTVIQITGVWKNTTNESISPKIKFSAAPGGTNTMGAGSYIRFTPVANPTVGSWT